MERLKSRKPSTKPALPPLAGNVVRFGEEGHLVTRPSNLAAPERKVTHVVPGPRHGPNVHVIAAIRKVVRDQAIMQEQASAIPMGKRERVRPRRTLKGAQR